MGLTVQVRRFVIRGAVTTEMIAEELSQLSNRQLTVKDDALFLDDDTYLGSRVSMTEFTIAVTAPAEIIAAAETYSQPRAVVGQSSIPEAAEQVLSILHAAGGIVTD